MKFTFLKKLKRKYLIYLFLIPISLITISFLLLKPPHNYNLNYKIKNTLGANNILQLKNYKIILKISFKQPLNQNYIVNFCNQYSWILSPNTNETGIYQTIDPSSQKRISQINYTAFTYNKTSEDGELNLTLQCNLTQKKVSIYANNKFYEEINLKGKNLQFYFNIIETMGETTIKKIQLYDSKGKIIFNYSYYSIANQKYARFIAQILFILGIIILSFLIFFQKNNQLFKYTYIICILIIIEFFLRFSERNNPILNISFALMHSKWNIEEMTNLFQNHNNIQTIKLYKTDAPAYKIIYPCKKNKLVPRIICIGSSPTEGTAMTSGDSLYCSVLEKKLNKSIKKSYEVINAGVHGDIFTFALYFQDVLLKLNPDIIIIYCDYTINPKNFYLFKNITKIMQENSSWISNNPLLFTALEFKKPFKELVYLYNFLCNSFLFMGLEYIRKYYFQTPILTPILTENNTDKEKTDLFEKSLIIISNICAKNNIKILLIPQMSYPDYTYPKKYLKILLKMSQNNNHIFYLDPRYAFKKIKDLLLFYDASHLSENGHKLLAQKIYDKLISKKLAD